MEEFFTLRIAWTARDRSGDQMYYEEMNNEQRARHDTLMGMKMSSWPSGLQRFAEGRTIHNGEDISQTVIDWIEAAPRDHAT